jgi:hypothetical protein
MRVFARLSLLLVPMLLVGCYFENPLTSSGSENINTWFLGEWEHRDKGGAVSRAIVTPAANDLYRVQVSIATKGGGRREYDFEAWASDVGNSVFLTFQSLRNSQNLPQGAFIFAHPQMLDQNTIRLRPLQLDSPTNAKSMALRKEVRARLKEGTLYPMNGAQDWKRVGEVYWTRDGDTGAFKPIRYEIPKPQKKNR